ncbi:MAG: hypothetical protein MJE63_07505 [Proteobacteria bacterium]|nr:hypothetical protein [Pseudomonadota bacterium]
MFNLQEATYRYYTICDTINEHLIDVDIIDFEKKQFVFLLDNTSRKNGKKSQEIALKITELKEESAKTLRTLILTKEGKLILSWESFFNQLFFFYNRETNQYLVMDSNFQPTSHPLISVLNEYRDVKNTYPDTVFKIHPKLPFAVIKGKTKMWIASWKDSKISLTPIIYRPEFSYKISISPDGKWFMLSKTVKLNSSGRSVKAYYAMPVDENIPYYLGDPISLGIDEEPDDVLWTVNPTSLVAVNQFSHITRWVLEGQ